MIGIFNLGLHVHDMNAVAARLAAQWNFEPAEELPGGFCSHVYASKDKVLKVPFQGEEMTSGYLAMIRQTGPFAPKIFHHDPATGSMLMERAIPGIPIRYCNLEDQDLLSIWQQIALQFRQMSTEDLMPMSVYTNGRDPLANHLLATTTEEVALHGDLHHGNILKHNDGWMCIDSKGLLGDPAIEGAAFVCNPWPDCASYAPEQFLTKIMETADALTVDPFRVWGWSLARMREEPPVPGSENDQVVKSLLKIAHHFDAEKWT